MAKDQLEKARKTYEQAKADPNATALAPFYLTDAENALQEAEQAGNSDEMIHLSYVAERKAQIAMTIAEGKKAEENIRKLNTETAELLAQKKKLDQQRELEMKRSQMEAERARLAAKMEAERAAKAKAEADMLMKELSELKARQTERGIVLTIGEVLFAFAKADLSSKADRNVYKLAKFLQKYPNRNVLIEGHTDNIGSEEYNQDLSQRRAESVKEKLVGDGVGPDRITTVGYGKKYPAVSNDTDANRALNRRVEVIILHEGVQADTQLRE
ncbi:MAG: OmpA family protein [Deltaproteobacteria bacterium]|nr:OmpA family protein [Deltaproteobacteria bacterium]